MKNETRVGDITPDKYNSIVDSLKENNKKIVEVSDIMKGIIVVLFVSFLGVLFGYFNILSDTWRHKEDVYYRLLDRVYDNGNCQFINLR